MSTKNASALARARSAKTTSLVSIGSAIGSASYQTLDDADDWTVLTNDDLSAAIGSFLGDDVAKLQKRAQPLPTDGSPSSPSSPTSYAAAKKQLLATLGQRMAESESSFKQMRGLLKKRGGAARLGKETHCLLYTSPSPRDRG